MLKSTKFFIFLGTILIATLGGCIRRPSHLNRLVQTEKSAHVEKNKISITAEAVTAKRWKHETRMPDFQKRGVLPVQIRVTNNSSRPVTIKTEPASLPLTVPFHIIHQYHDSRSDSGGTIIFRTVGAVGILLFTMIAATTNSGAYIAPIIGGSLLGLGYFSYESSKFPESAKSVLSQMVQPLTQSINPGSIAEGVLFLGMTQEPLVITAHDARSNEEMAQLIIPSHR